MDTAQKIAIAFSREIRDCTTESQLAEINRRNASEEWGCATHDFMDANEQMHAAFIRATGRDPLGEHGMTDSDIRLWNEAWEIARAARFTLE